MTEPPFTVAEVAALLGISVNTVHTHRYIVYRKYEVSSLIDLLREMGWLQVPTSQE